jgi:hypothetical protein
MNDLKEQVNHLGKAGGSIRLIGWGILALSIFFALSNKTADPPYIIAFWLSFAVLIGISAFYAVARSVSDRWASKAVRSYFSPYILGATVWLLLFGLFLALDHSGLR